MTDNPTTARTCDNCAHRNHHPEFREPDCWNLIPIEGISRCEYHQTPMEDAADIAARAAIRKAKGATQ